MPSKSPKSAARTEDKSGAGGRIRSGRSNGAKREQEVLDAATKVFYSRGYADASVQDIADELGILKGSLYHYIDSKEDLLFRLMDETHDEVQKILEQVEALEDATPLQRLHDYFARQVVYMTRNLARMAIYYHDMDQLSPARHKELMGKRLVHQRYVMDLIAAAQQAGEIDKSIDPALTVNYMFGTLIWTYRWYRPTGKFKAAEVADGLADFVTQALRPTGA